MRLLEVLEVEARSPASGPRCRDPRRSFAVLQDLDSQACTKGSLDMALDTRPLFHTPGRRASSVVVVQDRGALSTIEPIYVACVEAVAKPPSPTRPPIWTTMAVVTRPSGPQRPSGDCRPNRAKSRRVHALARSLAARRRGGQAALSPDEKLRNTG